MRSRGMFEDGSSLSATTQMWGAMGLYETGKELERKYIKGMRPTPIDPEFTAAHLSALIGECAAEGSRSVKGLLTQDQLIPGLGNALAQDIMFKAKLHPRQPVADLNKARIRHLHKTIVGTVNEAIRLGACAPSFQPPFWESPGGGMAGRDSPMRHEKSSRPPSRWHYVLHLREAVR
jgi:formamidopyrimidine-DNA glycosylase